MPSQRTAIKRHSSLSPRGRSCGPFHRKRRRSPNDFKKSTMRIRTQLGSGGVGCNVLDEDGAHALGDLARAERLGHIFVSAAKQTALAVDLLALGAEHDHVGVFERWVLFDLLAHFVAV